MKCRGTKNATGSVSEGGKLSGDELSRMEQDKEVGGGTASAGPGLRSTAAWDSPGGPVAETPSSQPPSAGGLGLIPGRGTRSHMLQLRDPACCN